jgi:hypothetical protein
MIILFLSSAYPSALGCTCPNTPTAPQIPGFPGIHSQPGRVVFDGRAPGRPAWCSTAGRWCGEGQPAWCSNQHGICIQGHYLSRPTPARLFPPDGRPIPQGVPAGRRDGWVMCPTGGELSAQWSISRRGELGVVHLPRWLSRRLWRIGGSRRCCSERACHWTATSCLFRFGFCCLPDPSSMLISVKTNGV